MIERRHLDARGLILRIDKVVKRFGNVTALENVSLNVRRGEIHVLCGENGLANQP